MAVAAPPLVVLVAAPDPALGLDPEPPAGAGSGFTVARVATGREAVDRCLAAAPDCLVLARTLPDMAACDVIDALPHVDGLPSVAVLVLAGAASNGAAPVADACLDQADIFDADLIGPAALGWAIRQAVERHRLRRRLAASQAQLALLARREPAGTFRAPAAGEIGAADERWCALLGLSAADALGGDWRRAVHPDDLDALLAAWQAAADLGAPLDAEFRVRRSDDATAWVRIQAAPESADGGPAVAYVGTVVDVTERKLADAAHQAAVRRSNLLAEAGRRLAESLEPGQTLAAVTGLLVPALADWCIVDLIAEHGAVERVAVVHADPARAELAVGLRQYPPDLARIGVAEALRTGRPDFDPEVDDSALVAIARDEYHLALLRALGVVSHLRVPLIARRRVLGSLLLVTTESGRRYGADDVPIVQELAARCALALDNARLHADEEQGRLRAVALADATHALTEAEAAPDAVLAVVAQQAARHVGDLAIVRLLADDGRWLIPAAIDHVDPALRAEIVAVLDGERHPVDQGANGAVLRSGRPQRLDGPELDALRRTSDPRLWPPVSAPTRALLAVPLRVEGRAIGTLSVSRSAAGRPYGPDDERFLQELADRAALAIERARLFGDVRASAERLRHAADLIGLAPFTWHVASGALDWDARLKTIWGLAPDATVNFDGFLASIVAEDRSFVRSRIERALDPTGDGLYEAEFRVNAADGVQRWVTARARARFEAGRAVVFAGVAVDVTEQRRAEATLDRYRLLSEHGRDILLFVRLSDGRIVEANAAAEAAYGYARDQLLGLRIGDLRAPETLPELAAQMAEAEAGGLLFETVHRRRDGSTFPVEVSARGARIGGEQLLLSIIRDISGRKRGEAERERLLARERQHALRLRKLATAALAVGAAQSIEATLREITEQARDLVGTHQAATSLVVDGDWSRAITAISLSERYAAWAGYDARPDGSGIYATVCRQNRPVRLTQAELEAHPDWRRFGREADRHPPLRGWLAVPLIGRDGRNLGLVHLSDRLQDDFTEDDEAILVQLAQLASVAVENDRLLEEVRQAVHARDQFLSIAAHELRTPITALKGYTQLLRRAAERGPIAEERLGRALVTLDDSADRLTTLTRDLLDVARLRTGRLPIVLRPLDVVALTAAVAEASRELLGAQHELTLAVDEVIPPVQADSHRIEQVLINLIENAIKYSPDGGAIAIRVDVDRPGVLVRVTDNGIGLPPGSEEAIFEPFGRARNAEQRAIQGMGLGLHICRQIVERHGGHLWAASAGEERGTTLSLWLPEVGAAGGEAGRRASGVGPLGGDGRRGTEHGGGSEGDYGGRRDDA